MSLSLLIIVFIFADISLGYHVVTSRSLSWNDARAYCISTCKSDLAVITDQSAIANITSQQWIPNQTVMPNVWLGINDDTQQFDYWIDDTPFDSGVNTIGAIAEVGFNCVLQSPSGTWATYPCDTKAGFVCNYCEPQNYKVLPNLLTYDDANQLICQDHCNSNLATINTDKDYRFAKHALNNALLYPWVATMKNWIGLEHTPGIVDLRQNHYI